MTVLGRAVYSATSIGGVKMPALAEQVHSKLTHTPVMGIDIFREYETGNLYVLELNSRGSTWHISSNHGLHLQHDHGLDYAAQFGALDNITERLVDATRRLAM